VGRELEDEVAHRRHVTTKSARNRGTLAPEEKLPLSSYYHIIILEKTILALPKPCQNPDSDFRLLS